MEKKIKKNRYRKVNTYIPVCILLTGAVVVAGGIGWGIERGNTEEILPKILEWERKEEKTIQMLPDKVEYDINLDIPSNIKLTELEGEIKLTWNGSSDAMAYDVCIDDKVYEQVYTEEFIHKKSSKDENHTYKVRARRYGSYTKWSEVIFYTSDSE